MSSPATTSMTAGRGLWRWMVALVATVMLVVSGSGLVVFAQSGAGESQGPQFVPADSAVYVEVRLDMPGGQDEALAQMMTAFPGFADAGSFQMKLEELLTGLTGELGMDLPAGDLFGDVLTGEMGLAMGELESAMMGAEPGMTIGMAIADEDAAASFFETTMGSSTDEATDEMYNDVAIVSDATTSAAMHGGWLLLGNDSEQVKAAIDVLDGNVASLADDPDFATAFATLPTARLGAAYMDLASFAGLMDMAGMMAEGQTGMALPTGDLAALLPKNMVMSLAAESDRANLEVAVTPSEMSPAPAIGESDLAMRFPADTQVYVETRELGAVIQSGLEAAAELMAQAEMPSEGAASGMSEIEVLFGEESPITAMLGVPLPEFLDFVGDAGIGAGLSSDGMWLGIAGEINDEAAAQERLSSLMTVLRMLTMQMEEEGVSIDSETVGDVEVTTITLPIDQMLMESGVPMSVGDTISVAIADGALLIGLGDFVQSVVAGGTDSLGTSPGYLDALGDDTVNAGVTYVNISSLLTALDPMLAMMGPEWEQIAPYAQAVDRMIVVPTADDDGTLRARMSVIVGD